MLSRTFIVLAALLALISVALAEPPEDPPQPEPPPTAHELEPNLGWLNTDRPLRFSDELKGHVVVLDFWTYCCINCMHILPDLAKLEAKYKDDPVVVIGVHSAKFNNESDQQAIRKAVARYAIHHPVVVDKGFAIWKAYEAQGWPSFSVVGADGKLVPISTRLGPDFITSGEGNLVALDDAIRRALAAGKASGTLAKTVFRPKLDSNVPGPESLAFPGKVLAVSGVKGLRPALFIADSTHNRVIHATLPDASGASTVKAVFGFGDPGFRDGDAAGSKFQDPQGMACDGAARVLYVADTRNHAVRRIDLSTGDVTTLVGTGEQGRDRAGGKQGREQALNSPWDLALTPDGKTLYAAMAGSHQIWKIDTTLATATALAGGRGEGIVDAKFPVALLAQPSGVSLAPDGARLYIADSECSAVRYLDFKNDHVRTIVGTGLFDFGDVDGTYPDARLQHPLGVAVWKDASGAGTGDKLLVADTYNHKLKLVDPAARSSAAWIGVGRAAPDSKPTDLVLDEPGGLCIVHDDATDPAGTDWVFIADTNHHRVVRVNAATKAWTEVKIGGLR